MYFGGMIARTTPPTLEMLLYSLGCGFFVLIVSLIAKVIRQDSFSNTFNIDIGMIFSY